MAKGAIAHERRPKMAYGYGDSIPLSRLNPITKAHALKPHQVENHPWYESAEPSEEYLARKERFKEGLTPEK